MKHNESLFIGIVNILIYSAIFIFSAYLPTDPDLGWHLKYGEYFFKTGQILRENFFSTMMPDYAWANHSWASDVLIYYIYNNFGFIGITILGAGIVTLTFFVLSKAFKLTLWNKAIIFPIVLLLVSNVNAVSFRSQLVSYFFTAVLFYILSLYEKNPKRLLFVIPLFLAWANFHGGFILGIILLMGYLGIKKIIEIWNNFSFKKILSAVKFELLITVGLLIATLINPFGYGIYLESLNHFGNPWLKYVSEWAAFEDLSQQWWKLILFTNLFLGSVFVLFVTGKIKKTLPFVILIVIFLGLSFYERRYSWSMYYISAPILLGISEYLKPTSKSIQNTVILFLSFAFVLVAVQFKHSPEYYLSMNWSKYCLNPSNLCSYGAMDFISKNNLTNNISTPYSWGGWMIWNFPEIKPSIDGRMHVWRDKDGYSAFGDYYTYVQDWESIDKSRYNTVLVLKQKPMFKRLKKLTKERKWKFVYEDRASAVFVRK
ncbi:MAG: hypothetical protein HYT09_03765 [Candidatus Levybacteria bacterium]|nr:hypothetical protein [Candidatus Levybacteria bacterium]